MATGGNIDRRKGTRVFVSLLDDAARGRPLRTVGRSVLIPGAFEAGREEAA
jgi:hypothetical protein